MTSIRITEQIARVQASDDVVHVAVQDQVVGVTVAETGPQGAPGPQGSIGPSVKGAVFHEDDANVDRPDIFASVEWVGSVTPNNAINGDTWIDTTA